MKTLTLLLTLICIISSKGCTKDNKCTDVLPSMTKVEWSKELKKSATDYVVELSGLCLSKDGDFLWGVGDNGQIYKIQFDGSYELYLDDAEESDMEGITIDPATGDLYLAVEPNSVYKMTAPDYNGYTKLFGVEGAAQMKNSGIEGITWYKGDLYLGAQTNATLWKYSVAGNNLSMNLLTEMPISITEIADLCYDPESDLLWVIDSNEYKILLFNGDATKLLTTYDIKPFADWNPESICVDRAHGCIWIADDCGDDDPSILHKVSFSNL
ncbi:MAG: hypothetical protein IK143_07965 [Bacteroidales bacterium]|nr:hypothetical protein [Bacteroidales bacterium]